MKKEEPKLHVDNRMVGKDISEFIILAPTLVFGTLEFFLANDAFERDEPVGAGLLLVSAVVTTLVGYYFYRQMSSSEPHDP